MSIRHVILRLSKELKKDQEYYYGWKANIAMAYIDCERWYKEKTGKKHLNRTDKHIIANNAADYFLKLLMDNTIEPNDNPNQLKLF
jgi:hypothetical protein